MKVIHYTLFVYAPTVKAYLLKKGVDPETVYLNDYKFMSKVFHILVRNLYLPNLLGNTDQYTRV